MTGFRHLEDETLAELNRLRVARGTFVAPDGTRFVRDVVRNLPVVAMVPLLDDGATVLLVRQYRGPIDAELLELPAGLCDEPGEERETTARRELAEEAGRRAASLEVIATVHPAPGFSDQVVTIYLATGLSETDGDPQGVEEHYLTLEEVALADVPAMVADGRLTDSKTIIGLLSTRERLGLR